MPNPMLKIPKQTEAELRVFEEHIYETIAAELKAGIRRDGLWLKATAGSSGHEESIEARYIELRFQSLLDEWALAALYRQDGAQSSSLDLLEATMVGNLERVLDAISRGADVNAQNEHGSTPILLAALHNYLEIAETLLNHGADRQIANHSGKTAVTVAKENGHNEIVQLFESGDW